MSRGKKIDSKGSLAELSAFLDQKLSTTRKKFMGQVEKIQTENPEIGFVCRSMVSASMPHSKVRGVQYRRKSHNFTLTIVGNDTAGGIPYGTYPRLILSWLASEVVRTKSREITLGASLSEFMKSLDLSVTGGRWGTITRFKNQLKMLFSAHISFTYEDKLNGRWYNANINIADKSQIFWNPRNPQQIDLFRSKVLLGESFFEEIIKAPIPVDVRAINALKSSSLALDIYFWLTYRLGYLTTSLELPFYLLQMQFGAGYNDTSQSQYEFKRKFIKQLEKVLFLYGNARVDITDKGLTIHPSPTQIIRNLL